MRNAAVEAGFRGLAGCLVVVFGLLPGGGSASGQAWDSGVEEFESAVVGDPLGSEVSDRDSIGISGRDQDLGDGVWIESADPSRVGSGDTWPMPYGQAAGSIGTPRPKWTGQVDALFLWMGNIPSRTLFINEATRQPAFDANEAQTEVAVAPRYAILFQPDTCRAVEVNYFQVQSFPGDAALGPAAGPYEIYDVAGIPPFEPISSATLTTSAQIKSLEANYRVSEGGPLRWLAGFRWVQWDQSMRIDDTFTDSLGVPGQDSISVDTGNNLYGAQLGCDAMFWNRDEGFQVNGIAKAGVFGNAESFQRTSVTSSTPGVSGDVAAMADQTAFFGEAGVNASMRLTSWLWWRAGYTVFWLSGVATPAEQLGLTDIGSLTTSIDTEGSVLLHGATTGLEARW